MNQDWFFSVLGNHECMFLMGNMDFPDRISYLEDHVKNGGGWAYKMPKEKIAALLAAVDKLPLVIQIGNTLIAHAALPEVSLEAIENDPVEYLETILWFREPAYPPVLMPDIDHVFVGHTPVDKPTRSGKIVNIDTGAFLNHWGKKGKLTIIKLGEKHE
jgi:serine/threonine protein phosphatase 1